MKQNTHKFKPDSTGMVCRCGKHYRDHLTGSDAHNQQSLETARVEPNRPSQPTETSRAWAIANRRLIERNRQIEKVRKLTAQRDALLDALRGACEEHDGAERIIAKWYIKAQDAFRLAAQQTKE